MFFFRGEIHRASQHIKHAPVDFLSLICAHPVVQVRRFFPPQIRHAANADIPQVFGDGFSDPRDGTQFIRRVGGFFRFHCSAIPKAVVIAYTIEEGSAIPFPAISMAVPWSAEVLMNGRPRVILAHWPNETDFMATSPWS